MKENNLVLDMEARHMDDIRVFMTCLGADWRLRNWSLAFCHEWEQEDRSGEHVQKYMGAAKKEHKPVVLLPELYQ